MKTKSQGREVIAHFGIAYIVTIWLIAFGFIGVFCLWFKDLFLPEIGSNAAYSPYNWIDVAGKGVYVWGLVIFAGTLIFVVPALIKITRVLIANGGAALWIEGGRLVYVYRGALDMPLTEIAFVGLTQLPIYYGVVRNKCKSVLTVRLKNGKEVNLPTRYSEGTNEVITRLRQRIGLPAA